MNTKFIRLTGLFLSVLFFAIAIAFAPMAHAQSDGDGGDCCGSDQYTYTPASTDQYTYTPSYTDQYTYTPASTDQYTYTPSYSSPTYSSGSYYTPSYSTPSYYTPTYTSPSYYTPTYSTPTYSQPSNIVNSGNTSTFAPTTIANNGNSCTAGNSCNTTYNGGNTTVTTTNPAPVINNVISNPAPQQQVVYQQPTYSYPTYTPNYAVCDTCSCNSAYCPQPVVYHNPVTPYVSLTAVPYTGLDLGPAGEVIYWSLLVLVAMAAAYLIAVKRVQNQIAARLKVFLFGEADTDEARAAEEVPATAHSSHHDHPSVPHATLSHVPSSHDGIDEFIMSQVNRTAHA